MKLSKYLSVLLLVPLLAFTMHKYYISLCEIEYNQKQESIQIILGLFIDDIEVVLNKKYNSTLNLATDTEDANINSYYEAYLNKHFKIITNEKLSTYKFIGKEYDSDIVRFYLEIENIQELKSIEIFNSCLFEHFEDQQNIIKLKVNKLQKTFYLNKNNANCLLKIQE